MTVSQELNVQVDSWKSVESQYDTSPRLVSRKLKLENKSLKCQILI